MWAPVFDEHESYLADPRRIEAFSRALKATVRPGDVVVDLGAGTGVLGMLAVRAGASKVYALEASPFGAAARRIIEDNGMADRIIGVRGESHLIELPERADVIVGDQVDGFVVDAGLIESFADAASHHLAPGGTLIPSSVTWHVAPVESADVRRHLDFWRKCTAPVDVRGVASLVANARRYASSSTFQVLAPATSSDAVPLGAIPDEVTVAGTSVATRTGRVDALAGWAQAALSESVELTNDPTASNRIDRPVAVFPLAEPLTVVPGDEVRLSVQARPPSGRISWRVAVGAAGAAQDTFLGEVLGAEELERLDPEYRPVLNSAGRLRHRGYELCDGKHTRAEIERTLQSEFGRQLSTPAMRSELLAALLDRFTAPANPPGG